MHGMAVYTLRYITLNFNPPHYDRLHYIHYVPMYMYSMCTHTHVSAQVVVRQAMLLRVHYIRATLLCVSYIHQMCDIVHQAVRLHVYYPRLITVFALRYNTFHHMKFSSIT